MRAVIEEDKWYIDKNSNIVIAEDNMISKVNNQLVSIVILSYNQVEFTKNCLESIRRYTREPYELIVIDNNSNKETIDFLDSLDDIRLIKNSENRGFAAGCNQGMELSLGQYILLINNDTIVTPNYLENMLQVLNTEPKAAIVGPYTNNTIGRQKLDVDLDYDNKEEIISYGTKIANRSYSPVLTPRLIGFCMLFRKEFIKHMNLFDEAFRIGNYEDDDLCIRTLIEGNRMYICNNSFVYHYKRATFDKNKMNFEDISLHNKLILEEKWNNLNWNHYAETNPYIEDRITEIMPTNILHIGCGIGAMGINVKQKIDCTFVGIENHLKRYEIASQYLDEVYLVEDLSGLQNLNLGSFDVIIIENMIEMYGLESLNIIEKVLKPNTTIFLRAFNKYHISTIESLVLGEIWGRTIGAASPEFKHYYGDIEGEIENEFLYEIINKIEIKKSLKVGEQKLYEKLKEFNDFGKESLIYNRIYELKKK